MIAQYSHNLHEIDVLCAAFPLPRQHAGQQSYVGRTRLISGDLHDLREIGQFRVSGGMFADGLRWGARRSDLSLRAAVSGKDAPPYRVTC